MAETVSVAPAAPVAAKPAKATLKSGAKVKPKQQAKPKGPFPVPNIPGVSAEAWKAAAAKIPEGLSQAEWHSLMLAKAEVNAGRHVPVERLRRAVEIAKKAGAETTAKQLDDALVHELMVQTTPSGKASIAAQSPLKVRPKGMPDGVTDEEWKAYNATVDKLVKGGDATLAELDLAEKVARAGKFNKSLATIGRQQALARAGVTRGDIREYVAVVEGLRSGKIPEQTKISKASALVTKLEATPSLFGHVPGGVTAPEWASYLGIIGALDEGTDLESLTKAKVTAKKAGHARIAKGLDKAIALKTPKVAPKEMMAKAAASKASGPQKPEGVSAATWQKYLAGRATLTKGKKLPYAQLNALEAIAIKATDAETIKRIHASKAALRPLEPADKFYPTISDQEYGNYAAVIGSLKRSFDAPVAAGRIASAKKIAAEYGHSESADLIASKVTKEADKVALAAKTKPAGKTAKAAPAKAAPTKKTQLAAAPSVITTKAATSSAEAERNAYLASVVKRLSSGEVVPLDELIRGHQIATEAKLTSTAKQLDKSIKATMAADKSRKQKVPDVVKQVPSAPSAKEVAVASASMGVPPAVTAEVVSRAKSSPEAREIIAAGQDFRNQYGGTIPPEVIRQMQTEAPSSPAVQQQLTGIAAAAASEAALSRNPPPSLDPRNTSTLPLGTPEIPPLPPLPVAAAKSPSSSSIPLLPIAAGVAAGAGAGALAASALSKKDESAPKSEPETEATPAATTEEPNMMKAQIAPGAIGGGSLAVLGLGALGLGLVVLSGKSKGKGGGRRH